MKTRLYKNPPPYVIVLASSVKTKEVNVIEFHRIHGSMLRQRHRWRTNIGLTLGGCLVLVHKQYQALGRPTIHSGTDFHGSGQLVLMVNH